MKKSILRSGLMVGTLALAMMSGAQARSMLDGDYRVERLVYDGSVQRFGDDGKLTVKIDGARISGFSGCNRFTGQIEYGVKPLKVGPLASTMMACIQNETATYEHAMHQVLNGAKSFSLAEGKLIFSNDAGNLISLVRADAAAPAGVERVLEISPERKTCSGVGKMECLQVREPGAKDWQLMYFGIEGFEPQPGVGYTVKVREERVENPPADAPNRKLILIETLETRR
ncbi:META and DUF4377 domain-containing protein [Jeongeupia sp. USM3]|uniref:META and DUF4377 domain-containing protein n=1 Tax=Jeongeupia sp. USM3 TaxID=1906741 RepID=UPI00089E0A96|nr:META and DUF4377 domain-containing protein [Jeongeupia sp. USM3]AOX99317.1 hypothetical protein BJP62_01925 [Jeongeupia sp. USM3]